MILFFGDSKSKVFVVETSVKLSAENLERISWALNSPIINKDIIEEKFIGPKSSMISPWSTNAVEITENMGVESLIRIEEFNNVTINRYFDRMIHQKYDELNQKVFANILNPEKQLIIDNIKADSGIFITESNFSNGYIILTKLSSGIRSFLSSLNFANIFPPPLSSLIMP